MASRSRAEVEGKKKDQLSKLDVGRCGMSGLIILSSSNRLIPPTKGDDGSYRFDIYL